MTATRIDTTRQLAPLIVRSIASTAEPCDDASLTQACDTDTVPAVADVLCSATRVDHGSHMGLMTIPQAARELNVPEGWLRAKVSRREVPHIRLGKHVRFTEKELRQIVLTSVQAPVAEPVAPQLVPSRRKRAARV